MDAKSEEEKDFYRGKLLRILNGGAPNGCMIAWKIPSPSSAADYLAHPGVVYLKPGTVILSVGPTRPWRHDYRNEDPKIMEYVNKVDPYWHTIIADGVLYEVLFFKTAGDGSPVVEILG